MTLSHRTVLDEMTRDDASRPVARSPLEVLAQQLTAIEQFHRHRHLSEQAAAAAARSREMRMDAARRLEVVRREHEALVARADEQLRRTGHLLHGRTTPRVVLAHRSTWFAGKVTELLEEAGAQVVASLDNGADAIGLAVAEQPDLLLVEDTLAMVPGEEVTREVRRLCSATGVVAHVDYSDRVGAMLEAGAVTVYTRRVPPHEVAEGMRALLPA